MEKLLLTATCTNSEGKKVRFKDRLVLKNYGNLIYFWDSEENSKLYILYVEHMELKEIGLEDNTLLTVEEFTLKYKQGDDNMKKPFSEGDRVTLRTKEEIMNDTKNFYVSNTLKRRDYYNLRDKSTRSFLPENGLQLLGQEVTIKCISCDGKQYSLEEDSSIYPATMFKEYFENEQEINLLDRLEKFRDRKVEYLSRKELIELLKIMSLEIEDCSNIIEYGYFTSYEPDINKIIDRFRPVMMNCKKIL